MHAAWFEAHCRILPSPDTIVHVGAGAGRELACYRQLPDARLVLVEPQPRLASALRGVTAEAPRIDVLECAVGPANGFAPLNLFNQPMLSSLRQPTGLGELLPGLRQTGQVEVKVRTLQNLVRSLDLKPEGDHWLVIDIPGGEAVLVDAVCAGELETCFSHVILLAGVEALYEGSRTLTESLEIFAGAGYRQFTKMDDADPDWPGVHLVFNEHDVRIRQQLAELTLAKEFVNEDIRRLRAEYESVLAKLRVELEMARSDLSVSLRTLALREADLKDLRERYAAVTGLKDRQHELLLQLGQRLGAASDYLARLNASASEDEDSAGSEGLARALTGSLDPGR